MSFLNFKRTLNTSCLGKTHQPPGFPIFGNWTWCPYSDLVALMAYQLGVGYATNLGCCEAPESEHDGGSYQNPAINGLFSRGWALGRTDVRIPTSPLQRIWPAWSLNHLSAKCLWNWIICRGETEKNTGVRSYFPVLLGEWEMSHDIYQCPVFLFRNVATAEQLKDYEWLPNTYLFLGQRLFQDRAVIRQKMAWKSCQVFDRLTEIDCAHRSQFQQWGTWGNDPQIELIFLGVWALSSTLREQRLTKIWSSDREVKQLKASCQRSSSPKQQRSEAGINRFWVPHLKSLNSGPFILFVPYFLLSFIPTLVLCWHSIRDSGFLSCLSKSPSSFAKVRHIALARQSAQGQESKGG